jgi:hypothetical protein
MDHNASGTARLFLAAVPDADTALRIYRPAAAVKRAHKFDGKIIGPDRLHISLFFLGGSPNPIARSVAQVRQPPVRTPRGQGIGPVEVVETNARCRDGEEGLSPPGEEGFHPLTSRSCMPNTMWKNTRLSQ